MATLNQNQVEVLQVAAAFCKGQDIRTETMEIMDRDPHSKITTVVIMNSRSRVERTLAISTEKSWIQSNEGIFSFSRIEGPKFTFLKMVPEG